MANRRPVRDFLLFLRDDANAYNRDRVLRVGQDEAGWCLSAQGEGADCTAGSAFTLRPRWPGITLVGVTPGLGFYGLRSTAWAGNLRLQSAAGSWSIVISHWGGFVYAPATAQGDVSEQSRIFPAEALIAMAIGSLLLIGACRFLPALQRHILRRANSWPGERAVAARACRGKTSAARRVLPGRAAEPGWS